MGARLSGKSAVVTGAGRGIGRAVALALAAEGARVVVNDLGGTVNGSGSSHAPADEVVREIERAGGRAIASYESVADFDGAADIINTCVKNFGSIDILANVAGTIRPVLIFKASEADWDSVVDVHLKGTFNCIRHAALFMKEQRWGRIINPASDAWRGATAGSNYGAAKGGIVSLTRAVARDMGRYGVTCNAIAPIAATTRMTKGISKVLERGRESGATDGATYDLLYDALVANPSGPEHIPPIVLYLATEEAANINGRVFGCSRGRVTLFSEPVEVKGLYKDGAWTLEELIRLMPRTLSQGLVNPSPPQPR